MAIPDLSFLNRDREGVAQGFSTHTLSEPVESGFDMLTTLFYQVNCIVLPKQSGYFKT